MLVGRVDRLDVEQNANQTVLTVVDYKTGRAPQHPDDIDEAFRQLAIYAVLEVRDEGYTPEVVKGKLLYLAGDPEVLSRTFEVADLQQTVRDVQWVHREIIAAAAN